MQIKTASIRQGPILFFKGIIFYILPMLELFEVDGGDKIYGLTGTGSLGLIKSIMSGGDSGCFCGKAISLLILLCIIVVSIPVALIIYKLLFGWERQLTHSHIHQKLSFFSWNRKNLYGLHFDERSFGDGGGRLIIYFSKRKDFSLSFFRLETRT